MYILCSVIYVRMVHICMCEYVMRMVGRDDKTVGGRRDGITGIGRGLCWICVRYASV
jgi:hypothetical protein